jgi:hypothetical protein
MEDWREIEVSTHWRGVAGLTLAPVTRAGGCALSKAR